jgi:hypothetical protein
VVAEVVVNVHQDLLVLEVEQQEIQDKMVILVELMEELVVLTLEVVEVDLDINLEMLLVEQVVLV